MSAGELRSVAARRIAWQPLPQPPGVHVAVHSSVGQQDPIDHVHNAPNVVAGVDVGLDDAGGGRAGGQDEDVGALDGDLPRGTWGGEGACERVEAQILFECALFASTLRASEAQFQRRSTPSRHAHARTPRMRLTPSQPPAQRGAAGGAP